MMTTKQKIWDSLDRRDLELLYFAVTFLSENRIAAELVLRENFSLNELYELERRLEVYAPFEDKNSFKDE